MTLASVYDTSHKDFGPRPDDTVANVAPDKIEVSGKEKITLEYKLINISAHGKVFN